MGKIIPLPDIEYKHWCNTNKELLEEMFKAGRIHKSLLSNRAFLERYLKERGYELEGGTE